jgi:outer membrane protein with beta-barrel domain
MKKILIFCAVMVCSGVIYAQSGRSQFGIKGGLNGANLHVNGNTDDNYKLGWHAGAFAHIHLTNQFALQPELMYSAQGSHVKTTNSDYDINLNYINVPVLLQYMTGSGFRLETGPQVGYLVHAENESSGTSTEVGTYYKNGDFSWAFGAGYKFASGFGIDARYNLGLSDISEIPTLDINNRAFQVGIFYQFKQH